MKQNKRILGVEDMKFGHFVAMNTSIEYGIDSLEYMSKDDINESFLLSCTRWS